MLAGRKTCQYCIKAVSCIMELDKNPLVKGYELC